MSYKTRLGIVSIVVLAICGSISSVSFAAAPVLAPLPTDSSRYLVPPSIPYGSRITRTMRLLATSTPEHKHRVRILFYGQSITGGWTDLVLKDLAGGSPTPTSWPRTAPSADSGALVVADGRGGPVSLLSGPAVPSGWRRPTPAMERMFAAIRERTTAEVLTFTEHVHFYADKRVDKEGDRIRELSEEYGYEVVDLRRAGGSTWKCITWTAWRCCRTTRTPTRPARP